LAWSAPMTATANTAFTAAQFNQHVRDNLLETAPGKATTAGGYFVATGANAIAERTVQSDFVLQTDSTASTSYVDLANNGPTVTVTTGATALVHLSCSMSILATNGAALVAFDVSGATTIAPDDTRAILMDGVAGQNFNKQGLTCHVKNLNPGLNIFTMKYRVGSSTGTFKNRELVVQPL
jgi:hypothetical protein